MKFVVCILLFYSAFSSCKNEVASKKKTATDQEEIIDRYLKNGAWKHHFLSKEWDQCISKGLKKDSTIAYLWQQKALPFWKQKKYSQAISFYNKSVELDRKKWLSRLGFLKCVFAKEYKSALMDLKNYTREFGSTYEQDHSLEFYMGLCYLQLNEFEKALSILQETTLREETENGPKWVHYLDRFYLAIAHYELGNYDLSILEFDKVLSDYPNFSDAQFYKSLCLKYKGKLKEAKILRAKGKINFEKGFTFNEDSSKYESYPYQVVWQWSVFQSLL